MSPGDGEEGDVERTRMVKAGMRLMLGWSAMLGVWYLENYLRSDVCSQVRGIELSSRHKRNQGLIERGGRMSLIFEGVVLSKITGSQTTE